MPPLARKQIPLRLPPELVERVDAWSAGVCTRNEAIEALIANGLWARIPPPASRYRTRVAG